MLICYNTLILILEEVYVMKALFIGGTGLISSAVSKLAVEKGIELYLLNRGTRGGFVPDGAKLITADITDRKSVSEALKGYEFDVVVDWIAFVQKQVEADIELFRDRTSQYIFISSASVYQKPVTYHIINESTPLANPYWKYSQDKITCEDRLMGEYRGSGFPVTIVRPTLTYGPTMIPFSVSSWDRPWTLVDRMLRGKKIVVQGDGTSFFTITHNTDFAKGFVGLMGNIHSIGHAFHITSDEALTWDQAALAIGKAAGVTPEIIHIPSDFIAAFNPDERGGLTGDKSQCAIFDNSKIKAFVPGFCATMPFSEGVKQSVEWFCKNPEAQTIDEEFNSGLDRIISAYEIGLKLASTGK
jgi:nucleoside-diphosphate-sugar epimerase